MDSTSTRTTTPPRQGRVRWRRAAALMVPSVAAGATLAVLTAQGVLGVQFAISGMPFTVTADKLVGQGFEQFGGLDRMPEGSPNEGNTGGMIFVVVSAIRSAELNNLCQSVKIGGAHLLITAGKGDRPVTAKTLVVDSDDLSGDASFTNIEVGRDSSTFDQVPGVQGPLGGFGQQADSVTIENLRQRNYATTAAVFKLPGLHLSLSRTGC